jgi:GNAT superfamily N-acetyltransferase
LQTALLAGYHAERELPNSTEETLRAFASLRSLEQLALLAAEMRARRASSLEMSTRIAKGLSEGLPNPCRAADSGGAAPG